MCRIKIFSEIESSVVALVMRIIETLRLPCINILIFSVTAHFAADRKGILDRPIIFRTRMRKRIAVMIPRSCRKIQGRARLCRATARRDRDDATRSIRAVDGGATALDDFDLLYIVDARQRAKIDARLVSCKSARIIIDAAAVYKNNDTALAIDGKLRIEGLKTVFAASISWCRNTHARDILQSILYC